ncbi:MAG: hypothetical protein AABW67_04270 [Nanoarchaeota archaeon]
MLSDTSYKTRSFLMKPTPFMGGSISPFEYMGQQHYNREYYNLLSRFNKTRPNFEYQQYKDRCKKRLCKLKKIILIKIKYNEKLSEQLVLSKLKNFQNLIITQEVLT